MVLEKTLESLLKSPCRPLHCKEIQPVHSKGDQSWVFFGRTDVEAKTPILWSLMRRVDSVRDWGKEEKGMTEDEMVGWHH